MSDVTPIGSIPPVGQVPEKMIAQVVRPERYGDPRTAFQVEEIAVPEIKPHEVLIAVMAAGINYNNAGQRAGFPSM
jgi:crotonyl-CoA carboxylase/reductase